MEEFLLLRPRLHLLLDNQSAITVSTVGGTWRSRYYAVRAALIKEMVDIGDLWVEYMETKKELADALTKLADSNVLQTLRVVMSDLYPEEAATTTSST